MSLRVWKGAQPKVAMAALVAASMCGCSQLRIVTGPNLPATTAGEPLVESLDLEVVDHRAQSRLRFLVFGDAGTGGGADSPQSKVARLMAKVCRESGGCDFALVTGDNIYPTGVESRTDERFHTNFEEPYREFGRFDFWMVTGNHDWYRRGSAKAEVLYSLDSRRWRMPALDYEVSLLPDWIAIYGLDTTLLEAGFDTGQVGRAKDTLCAAHGWRIVFGHHGLYTVGRHGDRTGTIRLIADSLLEPLIRRCGVHLYFSGHDHLQAHISAREFEQIVQGAGGRKLHPAKGRSRRPAGVELVEERDDDFGFAIVEADSETMRVAFYGLRSGKEFYCKRFALSSFEERPRHMECDGSVGN